MAKKDGYKKEKLGQSQFQLAWIRLKENKFALVSLYIICAIILIAIFAPLLAPYDYAAQNYDEIVLDASLSAKAIYLKRGYRQTDYHTIRTVNGDHLCYDVMTKAIEK